MAVLLGSGCFVAGMVHGVPGIIAGFAIVGIGSGLVEPNIGSIILRRSPHALHARASSLMISAMFLGQFLNPLAADPLRADFGTASVFLALGGATAAIGLMLLGWTHRRPRLAWPGRRGTPCLLSAIMKVPGWWS